MRPQTNRFEDFFADETYVRLKNDLYNYRLRRNAVHEALRGLRRTRLLEVGSGLSPMVTGNDRVVYSDLSLVALQALRKGQRHGQYVVADASRLPFRPGVFSEVIASEVLEHLADDRGALREMAGVLGPEGSLLLTVPHRQCYFGSDDRLVQHLRRYDLPDLLQRLRETGFEPVDIRRVLGVLEKGIMIPLCLAARCAQKWRGPVSSGAAVMAAERPSPWIERLLPAWALFNRFLGLVAGLEARLTPLRFATVIFVRSRRRANDRP